MKIKEGDQLPDAKVFIMKKFKKIKKIKVANKR